MPPPLEVDKLDDEAFLAFVQREESLIYQRTTEELAAWQNDARLGKRLTRPAPGE